MSDDFQSHQTGLTSPARSASEITPDDQQTLEHATRALYVGGAGALRVTLVGGETVSFVNVQPGMIYPLRVTQVLATGTTATDLVGLR